MMVHSSVCLSHPFQYYILSFHEIVFSITLSYNYFGYDEVMKRASQNIISRAIALGEEMGLHHPFIYQNYAGPGQDVFAGYGAENRDRLLGIQQSYDPDGVFSRLQPGHFKL
jgi:hypothetical protein